MQEDILNMNGSVITSEAICIAYGIGMALGKKVKLVNIGTQLKPKMLLHHDRLILGG